MIQCAYCGYVFETFESYRLHLKVLHNKRTQGDKLICGQNGCPLDYLSFQSLKNHCIKHHGTSQLEGQACENLYSNSTKCDVNIQECGKTENVNNSVEGDTVQTLLDKINSNGGIFEDTAIFVSRLRSHPSMSLATSLDIINMCSTLIESIMSAVVVEMTTVLKKNDWNSQEVTALLHAMNWLKKPFTGLETLYKQTKYFERKGHYIAPCSFAVGQTMAPSKTGNEMSCRTELLTGEFVSQKACLKAFLSLPGVFESVTSYLESEQTPGLICDFKDGELWKSHPVRLKYANCKQVLVIPVFDYFDDLEVSNPLGSHAIIHKIGAKYTVIKGLQPYYNSKLENILLNTLIYSSDRTSLSNREVFDAYLTEMQDLESSGFELCINGVCHKVFVVVVQVSGDNLGLNGLLGYVESFTANFPCRICKVHRYCFNTQLSECAELMRTRDNYATDRVLDNPSKTGIKEECCYNRLESFHVVNNVYCDIMHDLFEGVCRYVVQKLLSYLIFDKKYFDMATLNHRVQFFIYDHSTVPVCPSEHNIKSESVNLGAVEMLNFVLGLPIIIGDLVPVGDEKWEVFLLLRTVVLYCCALAFTESELHFMDTLISEFLSAYSSKFKGTLTLKFHNLTHYPTVIKRLGPLYNMWAMRCEGKHSELKKVAMCAGSFKNICKTVATRHQMRLADRLMAAKGLEGFCISVSKCQSVVLADLSDGLIISSMLGNYGIYRELFQTDKVSVGTTVYRNGDVLIIGSDDLFPLFGRIKQIFLTDAREAYFLYIKLHTVTLNSHYQAYEVQETAECALMSLSKIQSLPSPWALRYRTVAGMCLISLRHKI
jgi:hypothetical protein